MLSPVNHYTLRKRHWCPLSQRFAASDVLYHYLQDKWTINNRYVRRKCHWFSSTRFVHIYQIPLRRDDHIITMSVIQNPYVDHLLADPGIAVIETGSDVTRATASA